LGVAAHLLCKVFKALDAIVGEQDIGGGGELVAHARRRACGRAADLDLFLFEDDDIVTAARAEVVGDARAHDPRADDHDLCCLCHSPTSLRFPAAQKPSESIVALGGAVSTRSPPLPIPPLPKGRVKIAPRIWPS